MRFPVIHFFGREMRKNNSEAEIFVGSFVKQSNNTVNFKTTGNIKANDVNSLLIPHMSKVTRFFLFSNIMF